jgi:energy-coupling factor transport system permease protein
VSAPWAALVASRSGGRLAGIDPRAKLGWLVALFGLSLGLRGAPGLVLLALAVALAAVVGRVGRGVLIALRGLAIFVAVVTAFDVLYFGLEAGLIAGLRFALTIATFSVFLRTTPLEDLALALVRLGVPDSFAFILATGARFVPTVAAEAGEIIDAYRARGVPYEGTLLGRVRVYARILVPLVVGTVSRSIRLAEAMEARAFGYAPRRTPLRELRFAGREWLTLGAAIVLAALLITIDLL